MTESEKKANEIIEMYKSPIDWNTRAMPDIKRMVAKQCALIHVNGIIEALERASMSIPVFWQEVKRIIENK